MSDRDPIDALVEDARAALGRDRAAVPPDFAAVLVRSRRPDSEQTPSAAFDPAAVPSDEPVVDIRTRARASSADGLEGLIADARSGVQRMVEGRGMRAIPPMPTPARRSAWRSRPVVAAVAIVGLAAAVILTASWVRAPDTAELGEPTTPLDQAFRVAAGAGKGGVASDPVEPVAPRRRAAPVEAPVVEAPSAAVDVPELAPPVEVAPVRVAPSRASSDRLRTLGDEARARWQAGDRMGAEALFLEVARTGGRTALAELAWGDLFALADQLGDDARLAKRWSAYLAKFPRGRYADDARAGLCRRSKDPAACWRAYLAEFPRGSYRSEAQRATGTSP